MAILREAFEAAESTPDPNRHVTVASWPLALLAGSGKDSLLSVEIDKLLASIARDPSPVRRSDALSHIIGALQNVPRPEFMKVLRPFAEACLAPLSSGKRNKKGEARLAYHIETIWRFDPDEAEKLAHSIQGPMLRERALQSLEKARSKPMDARPP